MISRIRGSRVRAITRLREEFETLCGDDPDKARFIDNPTALAVLTGEFGMSIDHGAGSALWGPLSPRSKRHSARMSAS